MIAPAVVVAFFVGLIVETVFVIVTDRRAVARERAYWDELAADAAAGYGRVFDWEIECREFGCHEDHRP